MARPPAKELTERELEVMHVFWERGESTVAQVRDALAAAGRPLAYTTVATLIRILTEKEFLRQTAEERPFSYRPARTFEDVSRRMVGDLVLRLFGGSREQLLVHLVGDQALTRKERAVLEKLLEPIRCFGCLSFPLPATESAEPIASIVLVFRPPDCEIWVGTKQITNLFVQTGSRRVHLAQKVIASIVHNAGNIAVEVLAGPRRAVCLQLLQVLQQFCLNVAD